MSPEPPDDQTTAHRVTQVHQELREFKAETAIRFDGVDRRFDAVDRRFDAIDDRLDRVEKRIVESEVRLSTEIVGLQGTLHDIRDLLRAQAAGKRPLRG